MYERFLAAFGIDPERTVIFEDLAVNLKVPHRLGMTTVLVQSQSGDVNERMIHADDGVQGSHVHYATCDLAAFLQGIALPSA